MSDIDEAAATQLADTLVATLPKTFASDIEVTIRSIQVAVTEPLDCGADGAVPSVPSVLIGFRVAAKGVGGPLEGQPFLQGEIDVTPAALADQSAAPGVVVQRLIAEQSAMDMLSAAESGMRGDGLAPTAEQGEVARNVKMWIDALITEAKALGWSAEKILEQVDDLGDEIVDTYPALP